MIIMNAKVVIYTDILTSIEELTVAGSWEVIYCLRVYSQTNKPNVKDYNRFFL